MAKGIDTALNSFYNQLNIKKTLTRRVFLKTDVTASRWWCEFGTEFEEEEHLRVANRKHASRLGRIRNVTNGRYRQKCPYRRAG